MSKQMAPVIWLTGLSGSGKTSLGKKLLEALRVSGKACEFLDGDLVREFFENDLGYTREERIQNIRRICFAARLLSDHGITCVVANIAPFYEVRDFIRSKLPNYLQIYLEVAPEVVIERDLKGLYGGQPASGSVNLVGIDMPYDIPRQPDLVLRTGEESLEESFSKLRSFMIRRGLLLS